MLVRVALFAASLAASAALAAAMVLLGLAPARPAVTVVPAASIGGAPAPVTQIDTVYVVPTPSADPTPAPIVVQRVVSGGGDDGAEHEGGNG